MTGHPTPSPTAQTGDDASDVLSDNHYLTEHIEDVPTADLDVALSDGRPVDVYRDSDDGRRYGRHPWGFTIGYDETHNQPPTAERSPDGIEGK